MRIFSFGLKQTIKVFVVLFGKMINSDITPLTKKSETQELNKMLNIVLVLPL